MSEPVSTPKMVVILPWRRRDILVGFTLLESLKDTAMEPLEDVAPGEKYLCLSATLSIPIIFGKFTCAAELPDPYTPYQK